MSWLYNGIKNRFVEPKTYQLQEYEKPFTKSQLQEQMQIIQQKFMEIMKKEIKDGKQIGIAARNAHEDVFRYNPVVNKKIEDRIYESFKKGWPFLDEKNRSKYPYLYAERTKITFDFEGQNYRNKGISLMAWCCPTPPLYIRYEGDYVWFEEGLTGREPLEPLKDIVHSMAISLGEKKENLTAVRWEGGAGFLSFDTQGFISRLNLPE